LTTLDDDADVERNLELSVQLGVNHQPYRTFLLQPHTVARTVLALIESPLGLDIVGHNPRQPKRGDPVVLRYWCDRIPIHLLE
jgi:hypothetical protein